MSRITTPSVRHVDPRTQRLWRCSAPLRFPARPGPLRRGRRFLARRLVLPRYPAAGRFVVGFADGSRIELDYGETLGQNVLLDGRFEAAERGWLTGQAAGGLAIDVGANIGWHTAALAAAGAAVIAVEPLAANLVRLRRAVAGYPAVVIEATALGAGAGRVGHTTPADGAYAAVRGPADGAGSDAPSWPMTTLDELWQRHGAPPVRVVKIDVEGYELEVLRGGRQLLAGCRPAVLVETVQLAQSAAVFAELGYRQLPRPAGFEPWNHVFVAAPTPARGRPAVEQPARQPS
jgi:FkbM family methyltransferase